MQLNQQSRSVSLAEVSFGVHSFSFIMVNYWYVDTSKLYFFVACLKVDEDENDPKVDDNIVEGV